MSKTKLKGNLFLLATALLWGGGFIFQRMGAKHLTAFSFNALRMFTMGISFFILYLITYKNNKEKETKELNKKTLIFGVITGIVLFSGYFFQQSGLEHISAGKSGFLTSTQVVIIPILSIFLRKKVKIQVWISVVLAFIGFYILSMNEQFIPSIWDLLTILGAVFFSVQILLFDHIKETVNIYKYGTILSLTASLASLICALIFDSTTIDNIVNAIIPILYLGILSGAIAFVCEIYGHKYNPNPTTSTLIMSLQSVFALVLGMFFLNESISLKEGIGCIIVGLSVILSQLNLQQFFYKKKKETL